MPPQFRQAIIENLAKNMKLAWEFRTIAGVAPTGEEAGGNRTLFIRLLGSASVRVKMRNAPEA